VYRAAISVASGWGDGRVASGMYAATGNVITFCRDSSGPVASTGIGEGCGPSQPDLYCCLAPSFWRNLLRRRLQLRLTAPTPS
jgi:hypothetical protein